MEARSDSSEEESTETVPFSLHSRHAATRFTAFYAPLVGLLQRKDVARHAMDAVVVDAADPLHPCMCQCDKRRRKLSGQKRG